MSWVTGPPVRRNRMIAVDCQNQVAALAIPGEVFPGVINDVGGAQRTRPIHVLSAAGGPGTTATQVRPRAHCAPLFPQLRCVEHKACRPGADQPKGGSRGGIPGLDKRGIGHPDYYPTLVSTHQDLRPRARSLPARGQALPGAAADLSSAGPTQKQAAELIAGLTCLTELLQRIEIGVAG